eukprot:CAMPEP_0176196664 /NCGR_PEP_ID=MMETSP0121_2-20121125/7146_1 /TAXON_ID=160619 /ORGANISM="Kryptoperidinium foliaceum, Strain CCMP 1326" /LENGTH=443 /DNA_ID=CAMNT_0017535475 /DNA_START=294 /DNA_END=1625 /DNA_ORIENTATION=+
MILVGLFLSLLLTARGLMSLPAVRTSYTLSAVRSDVLRTAKQNNLLSSFGDCALVLQLEAGLLTYATAYKIIDYVESTNPTCEFLVLDWSLVQGVCDSALNTIKELVRLAQDRVCLVVFAGACPCVEADLAKARFKLDCSVNEIGAKEAVERIFQAQTMGGYAMLVRDREDDSCCVEAMIIAIEFVEEWLLYKSDRPDCLPRCTSIRSSILCMTTQLGAELNTVVPESHPGYAVALDVHIWLSCMHGGHQAVALEKLADALEIRTFAAGEAIYTLRPLGCMGSLEEEMWQDELRLWGVSGQPPPLAWLLEGEVEHCWTGTTCLERAMASTAGAGRRRALRSGVLRPNMRLEKAKLSAEDAPQCLGPFRTNAAFFGALGHVGRLTATQNGTRVALLPRERYERLLVEAPQAANALTVYTAKKQVVDLTRFQEQVGPSMWRRAVT